jgi:lysophospholipase L1-like esterase
MGGMGWLAIAGVVVALGCGGDDDGAAGDDAGMRGEDAGSVEMDAGRPDAGRPRDGGRVTTDGGSGDAELDAADVDGGPLTAAMCFDGVYASTPPISIDYEGVTPMPVIGSHCLGTDHQDIRDVERVVFLGDSVTVGTPPTLADDYYRNRLADALATRFGLTPPNALWKRVNPFDGTSSVRDSGDFSSCAEWGARTDDLARPQIADCFPASERNKRTLVIMTVGGNDIANVTQDMIDGVPVADVWTDVMAFVQLLEDAIRWFRSPGRFPNGVHVIFSNNFEFTDGTGDVSACPAAGLAGFGGDVSDPTELANMVIWATEQYMRIAVQTSTDMIFTMEQFCGHGFNAAEPTAPCYRGPGADNWFDATCIHPNPRGHREIADMFLAVVNE